MRFDKRKPTKKATKLWEEDIALFGKGWLEGPFPYTGRGKLPANGKTVEANPASCFGVQQTDKFRAVDDLKRSSGNAAAAVHSPINLPLGDHLGQLCEFFRFREE